jgi:hypothetical protein
MATLHISGKSVISYLRNQLLVGDICAPVRLDSLGASNKTVCIVVGGLSRQLPAWQGTLLRVQQGKDGVLTLVELKGNQSYLVPFFLVALSALLWLVLTRAFIFSLHCPQITAKTVAMLLVSTQVHLTYSFSSSAKIIFMLSPAPGTRLPDRSTVGVHIRGLGSSIPGFSWSRNGTPTTASVSFAVEEDEGQDSAFGDVNYDNNDEGAGVLDRRKQPRLSAADVRIFRRTTYVPSMRYGLAAVAIDEEELSIVQSRIIPAILRKLKVQSTIPTAIRHGPRELGGLDLYDQRTEVGIESLKFFRDALYSESENGKLLRLNLQ